jgi:hypothetical protein
MESTKDERANVAGSHIPTNNQFERFLRLNCATKDQTYFSSPHYLVIQNGETLDLDRSAIRVRRGTQNTEIQITVARPPRLRSKHAYHSAFTLSRYATTTLARHGDPNAPRQATGKNQAAIHGGEFYLACALGEFVLQRS